MTIQGSSQILSGTTLTTTSETTAVTTPAVSLANNGIPQKVCIKGAVNVLAGTGTTALTIRCRIGSLTGAVLGNPLTVTLAAAATGQFAFEFLDTNMSNAALQYFITVQQTAASGNGTINQANVEVDYALN